VNYLAGLSLKASDTGTQALGRTLTLEVLKRLIDAVNPAYLSAMSSALVRQQAKLFNRSYIRMTDSALMVQLAHVYIGSLVACNFTACPASELGVLFDLAQQHDVFIELLVSNVTSLHRS
jgi:hypothetical protein